MAFKFKQGCRTCALIMEEGDGSETGSPLYKIINEHQLGKRPLTDVARAYPQIAYLQLRNHSLKHQNVTENRLAKQKVKTLEREAVYKGKKNHHSDARQEVIDKAMDALRDGDLKLTASVLAQLLKQEADIEAKQTDQAIEMQKLFNAYVANPLSAQSVKSIVEGEVVDESPSSPL